MATKIRPEISRDNKYWIDKHRYYELKHFCLQYPAWKKTYSEFDDDSISLSSIENTNTSNLPGDPTAKRALMKTYFSEKINLIEETARETDEYLCYYLLKGVTEGLSYNHLKSKLDMPCGKDMYYDRYRRFFKILHDLRN